MTQYTIKPLEWENGEFNEDNEHENIIITANCLTGRFEISEYCGHYLLDLRSDHGAIHHEEVYHKEHGQARAQELCNDYLKQYLEEVK